MTFAIFPPEINSGMMYSGVGSAPMVAAASAWDSIAADLSSTASSYQSVVANLTTGPWTGPSSAAMATASEPYVGWLNTTAAEAAQVGAQAKVAVGAYETAYAGTVPPPVIAANRSLLMSLIATNFFGQNTPAIASTEALYQEMWAQDALVMDNYATAATQAMTLPQHTMPPLVANNTLSQVVPAAQAVANQASTVAPQAAATDPFSAILSDLTAGNFAQLGTDVTAALSSSGGGLSGTSGAVQALSLASIPARFAMYPMSMLMQLARMGQMGSAGAAGMGGSETLMNSIGTFIDGKMQAVVGSVANQLHTWGSSVSAQLGRASSLGGLSIPQAWSNATSAITRAAPILPATSVPTPAISAPSAGGMPGGPFGHALMGALSGRGLSSMAAKAPKMVPRSPAGG